MTNRLKDLFEVYRPKTKDEKDFVDKHVTIKHKDRNGNGDDVFQATNIKKSERKKERHGYEPGEDEKVYEEIEPLDEISKKTLGAYIKKASGAEQPKNVMDPKNVPLTKIAAYQGDSETGHFGKRFNQATYDKAERLRKNRETGIKTAVNKLTKEAVEEAEQIDELSYGTMLNYRAKTKKAMRDSDTDNKTLNKRETGWDIAGKRMTAKLTKEAAEEVEHLDEISATTKDSYAKKAVKQLPGLFNKSGKDDDSARKYYNRKNTVRKIANEAVEADDDTSEKNEMAQNQLHFIIYACKEINDFIQMGGEVEEWYQNKLSKAHSDIEGLHSYIEGEKRRTGMVKESVTQLSEGMMKLSKVHIVHHHDHPAAKEFAKNYTAGMKGDHREGGPTPADDKAAVEFDKRYTGIQTRNGFAGSGTHVYTDHKTGAMWKVDRHPNGKTFYGTDHIISHVT